MVDNVAPKTARIEAAEVKADSFTADEVNFDVQTSIELSEIIDAVRLISTNEVKAVGAGFKELSRTIEQKANEQLKQAEKASKPRNQSEVPKRQPVAKSDEKATPTTRTPRQKTAPTDRRSSRALPLAPVADPVVASVVTNQPQQEVISVADAAASQEGQAVTPPAQAPVKVVESTTIQQVIAPPAIDTNDKPTSVKGANTPVDEDFSKYKVDAAGRLRNANGKYASKIEKQRYEANQAEVSKAKNDKAEDSQKEQVSLLGMLVKSMAKISVARSDQDNPSKMHQMNAMADSSMGSAIGVAMGGSYFLAAQQIMEAANGAKDHIADYLKQNEIKTVGDAVAHGKIKAQEAKESIKAKAIATKENAGRFKRGTMGLRQAFSGDKKFAEKVLTAIQGYAKQKPQEQAAPVAEVASPAPVAEVASPALVAEVASPAPVAEVTNSSHATKTSSFSKAVTAIKETASTFTSSIVKSMSVSPKAADEVTNVIAGTISPEQSSNSPTATAQFAPVGDAVEINQSTSSSTIESIESDQQSTAGGVGKLVAVATKQFEFDKRTSQKEEQRHAEAMLKQEELQDAISELGSSLGGGGGLELSLNRKGKRKGRREAPNGRRGQVYGKGGTATGGDLSLSSGVDTPESRRRPSRAAGGRMGAAKGMLSGGAKMAGSLLSKAAFPLAAGMAIFDGVSGFTDTEKQKETFNLKEGQEASFGQKMAMATGSMASLGGLTELVGISSGDIAKGIYGLFGGDTKEPQKEPPKTASESVLTTNDLIGGKVSEFTPEEMEQGLYGAMSVETPVTTESKVTQFSNNSKDQFIENEIAQNDVSSTTAPQTTLVTKGAEVEAVKAEKSIVPSGEALSAVVAGEVLSAAPSEPVSFKERVTTNQEKITSALLPAVASEPSDTEAVAVNETIAAAQPVANTSSRQESKKMTRTKEMVYQRQAEARAKAQLPDSPAIAPTTDIESMLNASDSAKKTAAKSAVNASAPSKPPVQATSPQLKEMVTLLKSIDKTLKTSDPKQSASVPAKANNASVSANVPLDFSDSAHRRKANDYDF